MDVLDDVCRQADLYPCNLIQSVLPTFALNTIRQELLQRSEYLFCDEGAASVDILEAFSPKERLSSKTVRNADDLMKTLRVPVVRRHRDPECRMIFISARSSRDRLNITLPMMQQILSYHQVMPQFIEHVFAFGFREYSEDCYTLSFDHCNRLSQDQIGLQVLALGRSGKQIELCYGLKSVERYNRHPHWPWSVRQCSIYHSFDMETAIAIWIVVKGNKLFRDLVQSAEKESLPPTKDGGPFAALISATMIHETVVVWSGSNWQWYTAFLESKIQEVTRPTLSMATTQSSEPARMPNVLPSNLSSSPRQMSLIDDAFVEKVTAVQKFRSTVRSTVRSCSSGLRSLRNAPSTAEEVGPTEVITHKFSLQDLTSVHHFEERTNEALSTLESNTEVLQDMRICYQNVRACIESQHKIDCEDGFRHFFQTIDRVQRDLRRQQDRLKQLIRLINDRKALLKRILEYELAAANRLLAEKANLSADKMENIAVKTKLETVSMRIITLVTLFFLPGTFISTLMSTPIITFAPGSRATSDGNISTGALGFYCAVSLPLVVLTFSCWYGVYWWEDRQEKRRQVNAQGFTGPS